MDNTGMTPEEEQAYREAVDHYPEDPTSDEEMEENRQAIQRAKRRRAQAGLPPVDED